MITLSDQTGHEMHVCKSSDASGGTRTPTPSRATASETVMSTNSNTDAKLMGQFNLVAQEHEQPTCGQRRFHLHVSWM